MHQIRFRLGLCPDPAGGANTVPSQTSYLDLRVLLLRGEKEREDRSWEGEGKERRRGQKREKGKGGREMGAWGGKRNEGEWMGIMIVSRPWQH